MIHLGADPGVNGGLAWIYPDLSVETLTMPDSEYELWQAIRHKQIDGSRVVAAVEWIHPSIQFVKKAHMSKLYGNYMQIRMALRAARIPYQTVKATDWQPRLEIEKRGKNETPHFWKKRLLSFASEYYDGLDLTVSDAVLIAEYSRLSWRKK